MTTRINLSYSGIGEIMRSPEMQEVMRQAAEKGKAYAESIAPVGDPRTDPHSGEYKSSFSVEAGIYHGMHGDRAEAQLVNNSDHAVNVEWQDNHHVLARTAAELGAL